MYPTCEKQQLRHLLTSITTPIKHLSFRRDPFAYANTGVAPPTYNPSPGTKGLTADQIQSFIFFTTLSVKRNCNMAKNFSVAWLSQSSQPNCRSGLETALVHRPAAPALPTKHTTHIGSLLTECEDKDVIKIPSSPTSKYNSSILKSLITEVLKANHAKLRQSMF